MLRIAVPPASRTTARYETINRILSISFERQPDEHVDVVLSSNQRFTATARPRYTWLVLAGAVLSGVAIGLLMEVYRRFVLSALFDEAFVPPFTIVLLQFLPFVLLVAGLIFGRASYLEHSRRKTFSKQLARGQFIDTDVYENGIETTSGDVTVWMPWTTVRDVVVARKRIEILSDAFVTYLPLRAFPDKAVFHQTGVRMAELKRRSRITDQIDDLNEDVAEAA